MWQRSVLRCCIAAAVGGVSTGAAILTDMASSTSATTMASTATTPGPSPRRSSVGIYRCQYCGDGELHLAEFYPPTASASELIAQPLRRDLTTMFRRFRDFDQSESMIRHGAALLQRIRPSEDIAADVDFACLVLNVHHTLRVAPSEELLAHVMAVSAKRVRTPQQLEAIVSAFVDMADRERTRDLLLSLVPMLDDLVGTLRRETVVFLTTTLVNFDLAPELLLQSLCERAVMLVANMSFHELAQLCLALAASATRPSDIRESFEADFAPRLLATVDFGTAQDHASVLYAFAEVGVPVPDLVSQCATRLFLLHQDLDSDGVAMAFSSLALMELRAPKLTQALVAYVRHLDLATVTALGALDMGHAMAVLGVYDDTVLSMLTGRIMADRAAVLASPTARARLVALSDRLSERASSNGPDGRPPSALGPS